jgi:signal transduction histidine kinase
MRGIWQRTLTRLRDPGDVPVRKRTAMTCLLKRMLNALSRERTVRMELRAIAAERAALLRVAALASGGAAPGAVFAAVAEEAGNVLPDADFTIVGRYDAGHAVEVVGGWSRTGGDLLAGRRSELGGRNVSTLVFETGRPARVDDLAGGGAVTVAARQTGMRSAAGAPVSVEGRLWGVIIAASARENALPSGTEHRLAAFTELMATAIASAQAQAELTACRARIVATADETRHRIERDLHDGVQQRLVTLALQLRAVQETVPPQLGELRAELGRVAAGLTGTLDEVRGYARGSRPAVLAAGGLVPALKALARRSLVPVTLEVNLAGRVPERVEVTAYYVVSEALANAAKHARASAVHVSVDAVGDVLRLAVRDDGTGGADPARGSGLAGLNDRVAAIGGTLRMRSCPGEGTTLRAELPARPGQPPPASRLDGDIILLDGPGAPHGGNAARARTRVPQTREHALPDSVHAARLARLRRVHSAVPVRSPFVYLPGRRALAAHRTWYLARCATAEARREPVHGHARERARKALSGWGLGRARPARRDHRELVTNAIRDGDGPVDVCMSYDSGGLGVHDEGATRPAKRPVTAGDESGRGLALLDGLIGLHGGTRGVTNDNAGDGKTAYVVEDLADDQ